jgi:PAS domain S-box-containing protein
LDELNQKLEIRVESRTAALRLTNAQLKSELNERKKIERELSAERLRLMTMLGKISEAVIITDTENRISTINRVAAELTGWDEINAIGKSIGDVLRLPPSVDNRKTAQTIQEYIREQTGEDSGVLTILDTKSQARRLKITIVPIRTLYGEKSGTVFIFRLAHRAADAGTPDLKEYQA